MKDRTHESPRPNLRLAAIAFILLAVSVLAMVACEDADLQESRDVQDKVTERAFAAVPPYLPNAYPAREDINWYLQETETREVWYIYALAMDGNPLFYVVSDMKPRNICISITSPDRVTGGSSYGLVLSAPALDGVYYGKAGCDAYYMRDAITGGFIELAGRTFTLVSSKSPLFLETDIERIMPQAPDG